MCLVDSRMERKSSWVQHSCRPTILGGGSRAAIWRPISARRALRCLEMYLRPQQLRERTRRLAGRSRMLLLGVGSWCTRGAVSTIVDRYGLCGPMVCGCEGKHLKSCNGVTRYTDRVGKGHCRHRNVR